MAFNGTGSNVTSLNASNVASGTLAVARGGTGTASPSLVAGSGISVSGTWPNQTVATSGGGGVTSLNGQTGAITNTDVNAIGSYVAGTLNVANTVYSPGTTVSGSSLIQCFDTPFTNWYSGTVSASRSGTYRAMNRSSNGNVVCSEVLKCPNLWVRIS
jgi:hypothetical protein